MPQEVSLRTSEGCEDVGSTPAVGPMRRQGIVVCRKLPRESILVSSNSPRRNRKRNVSFSAELILESAVRSGELNEVRKFLQTVNPSAIDQLCPNSGVTILHQSVLNCDADMTQLIVNYGANIERRDVDGWTPLQAAAAMSADACVKVLLQAGADPYAKTLDSNESALDLVDVVDPTSVRCVKHLVSAMRHANPHNLPDYSAGARDSFASLSSISTCGSIGSTFSSSTTGSCPSPLLLSSPPSAAPSPSLSRSRSEDSGIDCIDSGSAVLRTTSVTPRQDSVSPLCLEKHTKTSLTTSRTAPVQQTSQDSGDGSCDVTDSHQSSSRKLRERENSCQRLTPATSDSDSDCDLEAERCGSVLTTWKAHTASSPMEPQSTSAAQLSLNSVCNDVDVVINTGSVARGRRRTVSGANRASATTHQHDAVPHRRLSFV
ncbi:uncharacterized protein LOC135824777 [Sycon ciliatum]|uniref:uncharacterized protein LOC135824777 n=1 Tax=Sycon ciliatum TaxID=27933 RepID=UPI0031F6C983